MKFFKPKRQYGFSIIEISVVMLVVSLFLMSIIGLSPIKEQEDTLKGNTQNIEAIEKAIQAFYRLNGYIPCPADPTLPISNPSFGLSTSCSGAAGGTADVGAAGIDQVRMGSVPTRTLSISDKYMFDVWNNRIKYVVIKELAKSSALFSGYNTVTPKVISIVDGSSPAGVSITESNPQQVAYILISHGKDGAGAYNYSGGGPNLPCIAGNQDTYNCASLNTSSVVPYTFRDQAANLTSGANYFDDIIKWRTISNIKNGQIVDPPSSTLAGIRAHKYAIFNQNGPQAGNTVRPGCGSNCFTQIANLTTKYSNIPGLVNGGNFLSAPAGRYSMKISSTFCGTQKAAILAYYDGAPVIAQLGRHFATYALENTVTSTHKCSKSSAIGYFNHDGVSQIKFRQYLDNSGNNGATYHHGISYKWNPFSGNTAAPYVYEYVQIELWLMD
jgi:prepilin-type N-terminal cleavage/methylation domain-containing protein